MDKVSKKWHDTWRDLEGEIVDYRNLVIFRDGEYV